jgi:uncharacterized protein (DUF885 family)
MLVQQGRRAAALLVMLAAVAFGVGCGEPPAPANPPLGSALENFVARYAREHPVWATAAGIHLDDHRLDDLSEAAIRARIAWLHAARRDFERFTPATLGADERVDRDVVVGRIDADLFDLEELRTWQTDPLAYTRLAADAVQSLLVRDSAPLETRLTAVGARLERVPALLAQARANLQHPPRVRVEAAQRQCAALEDFTRQGKPAVLTPGLAPPLATDLRAAAAVAAAALARFDAWLTEDLLRRADGDFRLGRAMFDRRLGVELQTEWTSDEIRRRAEMEVQQLRRRMYDVALPLWQQGHPNRRAPAPDRDAGLDSVVVPVLEFLAADHPQPDEILATCAGAVDSLTRFFTRTHLVELDPQMRLAVEWTPPFARGVTVAGLDFPGRLDGALLAAFRVQPVPADWPPALVASFLREYNRPMLQVLSMHEAVPGHFVQLCRARHCPHPVRDLFANGTFAEGWAVYAEDFTLDAGYGGGDPRLRLAQLKFALRSALNAILDVGVHCDGMAEPQALALLEQFGFQEETAARAKWLRVQLSAAQLCTYFVGLSEIRSLEAADRERAGAGWSRPEFVARLLAHGSPPVRDLRELLMAGSGGGRSSE